MLDKIKHTSRHTAIYGLGTIATKLIGIVLLPLYSKHITISEYGILSILEITIIILSQTLIIGQPNAFLRFYDLDEYKKKRAETLFTMFIFLLFIGLSLNLIGQSLTTPFSSLFSKSQEFKIYFNLCLYTIFLRIINSLFLSVLRAQEKSAFYVIGNVTKLIFLLGANIYFVAIIKLGIKGILYAYLLGDGLLFIILLPNMIHQMKPQLNKKILKASLAFGIPLIFLGSAHMILNMGDRYILKLLVDYKEVGLYNLGYRLAGIINVFLINPFSLTLLPMAYKIYGQKGDKRYYSKILTYFLFVLFWTGLGLSLFNKEIIVLFAKNPDYWKANIVVPYIVLGYIFSGAKSVVSLGLYLQRKTRYIAYNTIGAAVLNIGLNFLLIPKYKMIGAAIATIISFAVLYIVTYAVANHFYKIPYENGKFLKMLVVALVSFLLSTQTNHLHPVPGIALKGLLLILFPLILYLLNFYEPIEIERIKAFLKKRIRSKAEHAKT